MSSKSSVKDKFGKLANHPLQTWEWGEFRKEWGNEVIRFPFDQITLHKLPFTNFKIGIFEKGPMPTQKMLKGLKAFSEDKNLIFIKLEPNYVIKKGDIKCADKDKAVKLLRDEGAVPGKTLFTPTTFWIDLTPSEDELLTSFHPKTRYNIRVAQKRGVEVMEDSSDKAFEAYITLMKETVLRQKFYAHNETYHRLMWKHLHQQLITNNRQPIARLLTAKYKGRIITTWILFVWKDFLYYPYGASTQEHKDVMANNLMMWEAIRFGKRLGLKTFDLWGREEGKGFTKFKEGYNPKVVEFLGTWDLVTNPPLYRLYKNAEGLRWMLLKTKARLGLSKYSF